MAAVFTNNTKEEAHLFNLLKKAYIDARYKKQYVITEKELNFLIDRFTCHGRLFDSTKLTAQEFKLVTSKQLDPFVLYQNICDKYLADIAAAKDIYRARGDIQLLGKLNVNYRALFAMETVQAAKTPLQKLIAIKLLAYDW